MHRTLIAAALLLTATTALAGPYEDALERAHRTQSVARDAAISEAIALDPVRRSALLYAGRHWRDERGRLALLYALRRHPDSERVRAAVADRLGEVPAVRKWGTARTLLAGSLRRSGRDLARSTRRSASVEVGDRLGIEQLLLVGLDGDGNLVPIDPVLRELNGFELRDGAAVATRPSRQASFVVEDRKSGCSVRLDFRVLGPTTRVEPYFSHHRGRPTVPPGGDAFLRARAYDAAGNGIHCPRLVWRVLDAEGKPLANHTGAVYSKMNGSVPWEPHVNTLRPPRDAKPGPVTIEVIDPTHHETGRGRIAATIGGTPLEKEGPPALRDGSPDIGWALSFAEGCERAAEVRKPMFAFVHATWCPLCRRFERSTLADARIQKAIKQDFVPVMIDGSKSYRFPMRHDIDDFPSVVFFSADGSHLFVLPYRDRFNVERVLANMKEALRKARIAEAAERRLTAARVASPSDLDNLDDIRKHLEAGKRFEEALELETEAYDVSRAKGHASEARRAADLAYLSLRVRNFKRAGKAIERFRELYPKSKELERVEYYRGLHTFYSKKDAAEAARIWREQLGKWPKGRFASNGRRMVRRAETLESDRKALGTLLPRDAGFRGK